MQVRKSVWVYPIGKRNQRSRPVVYPTTHTPHTPTHKTHPEVTLQWSHRVTRVDEYICRGLVDSSDSFLSVYKMSENGEKINLIYNEIEQKIHLA